MCVHSCFIIGGNLNINVPIEDVLNTDGAKRWFGRALLDVCPRTWVAMHAAIAEDLLRRDCSGYEDLTATLEGNVYQILEKLDLLLYFRDEKAKHFPTFLALQRFFEAYQNCVPDAPSNGRRLATVSKVQDMYHYCDFVFATSALATVLLEGRDAPSREEHLRKAQECINWKIGLMSSVLRSGMPLFQILAMFERGAWAPMVAETHERLQQLLVAVMPHEDFASSFLRGYNRFHCDRMYKDFAVQTFGRLSNATKMLEIGTYLGDCALWTAGMFPKVSVVAVDVYAPAVLTMNRTRWANKDLHDRFQPVHACVGDADMRYTPLHRADGRFPPQPGHHGNRTISGFGREFDTISCMPLDDIDQQFGKFDLVRVHVNGNEGIVLRTGRKMWQRGTKRRPKFAITIVGTREHYREKVDTLHATFVEMEEQGYVFRFEEFIVNMKNDFLPNLEQHLQKGFATRTMLATPT
eukprot:GEMP01016670.1.p1 GENE.GEMP01016670.1~~GEMP01016670.1.p1  ORF type:complete len:513 (+),score=99.59 GEMP01016670.1:143-1540(+)